jgi:leader peptidase (prepilin peptidase)/N-methyltransferase
MIDWLLDPTVAIVVAAVVGLVVGSFLNVVIHRLPRMLERDWQAQCAELRGETLTQTAPYNLVVPRSACPACNHPIGALENIPVVSWLALRGRCAACGTNISMRYPIVELLGAALAAVAIWHFGPGWEGIAAIGLLWTLTALAFIDADTQFLPDDLTVPLLWAGLVANLFGLFVPLAEAVIGAVAGYLTLWSVYWAYKLVRRREGMGHGDFKLLAALGAWLGWKMLPALVLLSSLAGAIVGIGLIVLKGRDKAQPLPFGPYLAIAGAAALFVGDSIRRLYLP